MKATWAKLRNAFKDSETTLVASVDCTAAGKTLCDEFGVSSYPTLKYGDPTDLHDYKGKREYDVLKRFADELEPACGITNVDLCDEDRRNLIKQFQGMSISELEALVQEKTAYVDKQEADFQAVIAGTKKEYNLATKRRSEGLDVIKKSNLALMRAVQAFRKFPSKSEEL